MLFADQVKNDLLNLIQEMSAQGNFSKEPGKHFSRKRKLDFSTMMHFILSMEAGSLKKNSTNTSLIILLLHPLLPLSNNAASFLIMLFLIFSDLLIPIILILYIKGSINCLQLMALLLLILGMSVIRILFPSQC